jgi:hypothetical protein
MYPLVLSHDLVQSFKFWYQNEIREGMCSNQEMYRLCGAYKADDRQKAFSLAAALAEHGAQACVTCMRTEYKVWVSLRTQHLAPSLQAPKAIAA